MAAVSNTCGVCNGSGFIGENVCTTCMGAGVIPAMGMSKFLIETLNKVTSAQETQQEYLEKILNVVGGK